MHISWPSVRIARGEPQSRCDEREQARDLHDDFAFASPDLSAQLARAGDFHTVRGQMSRTLLSIIAAIGLLAACGQQAAQSDAAPGATAEAAGETATVTGFNVSTVPESTVTLPPFPFFNPLDGLESVIGERERNRNFDAEYFIAGTDFVAVEGRVYRDMFPLTRDREYSALEFQRNYEQAITALGGVRVAGSLETGEHMSNLEGRPAPGANCWQHTCTSSFYLIRQGGKEYWVHVGTGAIPLHGYITVAERQAMAQSFSFLTADALLAALDANGRVPVYIEFDVDRATLRPDARPAVDEIIKLMRDNPSLRLSVEGHTDNTGTPERNRTLSQERAATVQAALVAAGISADRLRSAGYGSDRPLAQGNTDADRARNRRVELVRIT
jgi:outer membrane protein OmpA-like peptidoglycan-associated protein